MPDERQVIAPRHATVGEGSVERYLPAAPHRMIGPWCFLDLFGRLPGPSTGVGPHPHIGIQTVTWLFNGASTHRDSVGSDVTILPGGLSLMTAGAGIAHAEEPPPGEGRGPFGAQLWIALPDDARDASPAYGLFSDLPVGADPGATLVVFAGQVMGLQAPRRFSSPIVGAEIRIRENRGTELELEPEFEHGVLLATGSGELDGLRLHAGDFVRLGRGERSIRLSATESTRWMLVGGVPFAEDILMWWNFVARDQDEIAAARDDWVAGRRFGTVARSSYAPIPAPDLPSAHLKARPSSAGDST